SVTSLVRICSVMLSPLTRTWPGGISSRMSWSDESSLVSGVGRTPARRSVKVTARYMAPVSRNSKPSRLASALAALLLPAPAGPSMVMTMGVLPLTPARRGSRMDRDGELARRAEEPLHGGPNRADEVVREHLV